jgi:hypothetical protein
MIKKKCHATQLLFFLISFFKIELIGNGAHNVFRFALFGVIIIS